MQQIPKEVIAAAADGDIRAFEQIFNAYVDMVFNIALRSSRRREDAQEITQDVFLAVHRKLKDFRMQSSLKTWIYRITVNMTINHLKKESRFRDKAVAFDDALTPAPEGSDIGRAAEREYLNGVTRRLLDALTPEQRVCIVLRNFEGLSYEEIARALGIELNTVRSRLKRAREKLIAVRKEVMAHEL
jgi:RNA polymerase sigma-70 factor (ECF subfamily)